MTTYKITLAASLFDSDRTDFVARVSTASLPAEVNAAIFAADSGGGVDVWFSSDAAGSIEIASKVVVWDDSSKIMKLDAKVPSVTAASDVDVYLHVGDKPGGYDDDPYPAATTGLWPLSRNFNDVTSHGHNGTAVGGVAADGSITGPDGVDKATDFDGVNDVVTLAESGDSLFGSGGSFTLCGWVKDSSQTSDTQTLFEAGGIAEGIHVQSASGRVYGTEATNGLIGNAFEDFTEDEWTHFAFVGEDGVEIRMILNGVDAYSLSRASFASHGGDSAGIGGVNGGARDHTGSTAGGWFFEGGLAEISAHNAAVPTDVIKATYLLQGPDSSDYVTAEIQGAGGTPIGQPLRGVIGRPLRGRM